MKVSLLTAAENFVHFRLFPIKDRIYFSGLTEYRERALNYLLLSRLNILCISPTEITLGSVCNCITSILRHPAPYMQVQFLYFKEYYHYLNNNILLTNAYPYPVAQALQRSHLAALICGARKHQDSLQVKGSFVRESLDFRPQ